MKTQGAAGGRYSFEGLCTPHYSNLIRYAFQLVGSQHEAKDIVQEAYLRAFRRWDHWRPAVDKDPSLSARAWLYTIVQHVCFDVCRARTGRRRLVDDNHTTIIESTYGTEMEHAVQHLSDGIGDEVRTALDLLDADQRAVVQRADFNGERYHDIATALDIPIGTVMSRLHRGRKRLAILLAEYAADSYGIQVD